ncbi:CaiB/BaiF CoA transferase family protein [Eubacterium sp.]|uniref:CaiB/BaiF CoA transferase family protein n=1 Tax=Eubacterium sp. TaxID=142586 RepID=UPI002FC6AECE
MDKNENRLLEGVRVLDLTRVLAGPYCGMLLADLGADVIKIENPRGGDDSRSMGPFVGEGENRQSAYYINCNRSKRGCTLNLKDPEGKAIFLDMVEKSDMVIENYRPGTMEKLGLGYDVLKEVNPGIIYGCVSGFGHTGPYSERAGYDIIGQAMGGLMSTTGWPDGDATRTGTPMGDVLGGLNLAIGILAALHRKEKTGLGEKVDIALVDSVVSAMMNINMIYFAEGRVPERIGNRYESTFPYDSFPAADGSVIIGAGNDKLYALLCEIMEMPELKTDPRFITIEDRVANYSDLTEYIVAWTKPRLVDEIVALLNRAGVPSSPVNTVDRVVAEPQITQYRHMFPEIEQPGIGTMQITNNPQRLTETCSGPWKAAPLLGENNMEIYGLWMGIDEEKVAGLKKKGVI